MQGFPTVPVVVLASLLAAAPAFAQNVGYQHATAPDPNGPPLEVGFWYPTAAEPSTADLELFTQDVAIDGAPEAGPHPFIVMSHGNGGSLGGHYDTALTLAHAGFVVAAVQHTNDNYRDHADELKLDRRAPQISAIIDYALSGWLGKAAIDPARIGMFGFSAGGFTALVEIGGKPELSKTAPYCIAHETTFVCALVKSHAPSESPPVPERAWKADPRIRAAVIAAPAVGFAFSPDGLRGVTVPVQLWAAGDDHILPLADNAELVRAALPGPVDYHVEHGADHFDFLAPCSDALAERVPEICKEKNGFDRAAFHERFNAAVVVFFRKTLAR